MDSNPWAAPTWNLTEQTRYIKTYGLDRAAARARDAGTSLGAVRPRVQAPTRPVYIFRRGGGTSSPSVPGQSVWFDGVGAPSDALGQNGNLYLDTASGDVYEKAGGTWS